MYMSLYLLFIFCRHMLCWMMHEVLQTRMNVSLRYVGYGFYSIKTFDLAGNSATFSIGSYFYIPNSTRFFRCYTGHSGLFYTSNRSWAVLDKIPKNDRVPQSMSKVRRLKPLIWLIIRTGRGRTIDSTASGIRRLSGHRLAEYVFLF